MLRGIFDLGLCFAPCCLAKAHNRRKPWASIRLKSFLAWEESLSASRLRTPKLRNSCTPRHANRPRSRMANFGARESGSSPCSSMRAFHRLRDAISRTTGFPPHPHPPGFTPKISFLGSPLPGESGRPFEPICGIPAGSRKPGRACTTYRALALRIGRFVIPGEVI